MINIILFGNRENSDNLGYFSSEIYHTGNSTKNVRVILDDSKHKPDIAMYSSRTDNQLKSAISICEQYDIPLIVLSTDILSSLSNTKSNIEIIYVPNASKTTLKYIDDVVKFHRTTVNWKLDSFTEWHQETKKSVSGTAVHIAEQIGYDPNKIISIRDDHKAHLVYPETKKHNAFALHKIIYHHSVSNQERIFELLTIGRRDYVTGAIDFAAAKAKSII